MADDDIIIPNWQIIPDHGIGPIALGMTWDQVIARLPDAPSKPEEFPASVHFPTSDLRVSFNEAGLVDWVDLGGAVATASFGDFDFDVFSIPFATLTRFVLAQDPDLYQDTAADTIASEKLGFVSWSNDGTTVASVVICSPAAYPETFGKESAS